MLKRFTLVIVIISATLATHAQNNTDTTLVPSPVLTLTSQQYAAYSKGDDINDLGLVARVHHYPLPAEVLKFKTQLDLSPIQVKKLTEFNAYMHRRTLQTGGSIISTEKTLDDLFKTKKIDEGAIIFYTQRYGQYLGEYRNAVLFACYSARQVLTPQQVNKLETLQKAAVRR